MLCVLAHCNFLWFATIGLSNDHFFPPRLPTILGFRTHLYFLVFFVSSFSLGLLLALLGALFLVLLVGLLLFLFGFLALFTVAFIIIRVIIFAIFFVITIVFVVAILFVVFIFEGTGLSELEFFVVRVVLNTNLTKLFLNESNFATCLILNHIPRHFFHLGDINKHLVICGVLGGYGRNLGAAYFRGSLDKLDSRLLKLANFGSG